jgi:alpha-glucosidase
MRLVPYLYTLFREASVSGLPPVRPLFFADPSDARLRSADSSFLLGDDLLVEARAAETGAFPAVRPSGAWRDFDFVESDPELPRLALRAGAILPLGPPQQRVDEKPLDPLTLLVALDASGRASGTLYEDAGEGYGFESGDYSLTRYEARREGSRVVVRLAGTEGRRKRPPRRLLVRVLGESGREAIASGKDGQSVTLELK